MASRIQLVNGYGVPNRPLDPAYDFYLTMIYVSNGMEPESGMTQPIRMFLGGGFTNRGDITEAQFMENWFRRQALRSNVSFVRLEQGITTRQNLEQLRQFVGDVPITIFCEHSRLLRTRFLASRLFSNFTVYSLRFAQERFGWFSYLNQAFIAMPLEVLAWYIPLVHLARLKVRLWRLRRIRSRQWS